MLGVAPARWYASRIAVKRSVGSLAGSPSPYIFALLPAKIADFLDEVRELFRDPDYLIHLETLVRSMPDFESKMESRRRLLAIWTKQQ